VFDGKISPPGRFDGHTPSFPNRHHQSHLHHPSYASPHPASCGGASPSSSPVLFSFTTTSLGYGFGGEKCTCGRWKDTREEARDPSGGVAWRGGVHPARRRLLDLGQRDDDILSRVDIGFVCRRRQGENCKIGSLQMDSTCPYLFYNLYGVRASPAGASI
jgi:hypothetical protein